MEWIKKAEKDMKTIQIMKEYDDVTEIVCFHCQQAVEKYLKALLIYNKTEIVPKTHNIDLLLNLCTKYDKDFIIYTGTELTTYAVDLRYPDALYIPSEEQMNEAIRITGEIIELCNKNMNIKEDD